MSVKLKNAVKRKRATTANFEEEGRICIVHSYNYQDCGDLKHITNKRWSKIQEVKCIRDDSDNENVKQPYICSKIPNELDLASHGFHDYCYNSFINLKSLKKYTLLNHQQPSCSNAKKRVTEINILFPKICLFCGNQTKWRYRPNKQRLPLIKCQTKNAEESIKEAVNRKDDQHLKAQILTSDLVARELWYHEACRKDLLRKESRHIPSFSSEEEQVQFEERKKNQADLEKTHAEAFSHICNYIEEVVIQKAHVVQLAFLMQMYTSYIKSNYPEHYNKNYKVGKLQNKLISFFDTKIKFWQRYKGTSHLVYSDNVSTGQAVGVAFENAKTDEETVLAAARILRKKVFESFKERKTMTWPPSNEELKVNENTYPNLVKRFLSSLYSKDGKANSTSCKLRVDSTAQDICFNITKGKWKMPKHIILGMAVRHITGCSKLITFLNRYGHSVSHSFLLELETAMCDSIRTFSHTLPPTIMQNNNLLIHFCWDNFDMIEETPSGAGTTHSTHGIVIQEIKEEPYIPQETPEVEKSRRRSIKLAPDLLEPCYINPKTITPILITQTVHSEKEIPFTVNLSNFKWLLSRCEVNADGESVPGWNGWLTTVFEPPEKLSVVDYMAPLNHPITEYSTVQEVLNISQKGSKDLQQKYTFVTFDLAVAKMAYYLVWHHQVLYNDVIIHLGVFHIIFNYLKAVGKLLVGSGFEEVVIDSKICASGSIEGVLKGKNYNRSVMVHKTVLESLERMLFSVFCQTVNVRFLLEEAKKELKGFQTCGEEGNIQALAEEYFKFKQDIRRGKLGKTAQFWLIYIDIIWNIKHLIRATKTNNLDLHIISLENMCPLFFSMDQQNYARFLTCYILLLLNLDVSHPGARKLLKEKGFSVCRSTFPASRVAVDQTIEQTVNRESKGKGGIVGFSKNQAAYQRWCITRHRRAAIVGILKEEVGINSTENPHKDHLKSQMKMSEHNVKKVIKSLKTFINPFEMAKDSPLISLSSGLQASTQVEKDLLTVQEAGKYQFQIFIQERLVQKNKSFHAPIKRNRKQNFGTLSKAAILKTSKKQEIKLKAQRNIFGQLLMLSEENNIDLQKVMEFPLGPIPWSLATADGMPIKTDKAALMARLEEDLAYKHPKTDRKHVHIIDGNALFHSLTIIPETFGEIAEQIFKCLPKSKKVHFLTDNYHDVSIKSSERMRRGESLEVSLAGPSMRCPKKDEWKEFLKNPDNKKQLIRFILTEWEKDDYASSLQDREIYFASENKCSVLTSADGITTESIQNGALSNNHEEADTLIILHSIHADVEECQDVDIIVRSPDTDVFLLLLSYCNLFKHPLYFDTGHSNKRRIIHMQTLVTALPKDIPDIILAFHSFTGCDSNSAFVQKGKVRPLKHLLKNPEFILAFKDLGKSEVIPDTLFIQIEAFVCQIYGGKPNETRVNKLRYNRVRQKYRPKGNSTLSCLQGLDISLLPPCEQALKKHILRSNYQTMIWRQSHIANQNIPHPSGHGWIMSSNVLAIDWCADPVPQQLIDIMYSRTESESNISEKESNLQCDDEANRTGDGDNDDENDHDDYDDDDDYHDDEDTDTDDDDDI